MNHYYEYNEDGEEIAVPYEGDRLPSPGHYRFIKGKWWKMEDKARREADYINVGNGVESPLDGKFYTCGRAYADHAKAHNCVLVGNDFNSKRQKRLETMAAKRAAAEKSVNLNTI